MNFEDFYPSAVVLIGLYAIYNYWRYVELLAQLDLAKTSLAVMAGAAINQAKGKAVFTYDQKTRTLTYTELESPPPTATKEEA